MTMKQIEAKQAQENAKYECAKAIRKLLDDLRKAYKSTEDADQAEQEVMDLLGEDE